MEKGAVAMNTLRSNSCLNNQQSSQDNTLLSALPVACYQRLSPYLHQTRLELGQTTHDSRLQSKDLYFPTTSIVSLMTYTKDGSSSEVAVIGKEGVVDVALMIGSGHFSCGTVQIAGYAYRISAKVLKAEFNKGEALQHLLLRYMQALITQISLTAVCNRHHAIEQQLCRWLLLNLDRSTTNSLSMTHELIANNLGVRREGVSEAASKLQIKKLIQYSRGRITVLDRRGLEILACECYSVVQREYNRLLLADTSSGRTLLYPQRLQVASR